MIAPYIWQPAGIAQYEISIAPLASHQDYHKMALNGSASQELA